ncbi:hypothetical protein Pryu01_01864 [Paraliobacillus ryukyuensis]|uniref:Lipoprotein n=1 Tax=Paraliobacillus ryukyuensis TaxID=200904 RepID=A0A366DSV7_9BACI|nr:hypothetical protein [Paraliobacillus ryukyuensis]RBO93170.1 hypothetical protein DES48_11336 [Paraliobacillus ryukyuensis]
MVWKRLVLVALLFVVLVGCAPKDTKELKFSKWTENWSATLIVRQTEGDDATQTLKLQYTGSDMDEVGAFSYRVDSVGNFEGSDATLSEEGTFEVSSEASATDAKVTKDTEAEVTLDWNGETVTFPLDRNYYMEMKPNNNG